MTIQEMIKRRQEYNKKILAVVSKMVDKYPDWRFGQILSNAGIAVRGRDCFYDESVETYNNLTPQFKEL